MSGLGAGLTLLKKDHTFLTDGMADAFGDWLERDRIQRALIAACPELGDAITHDELRPLLTIRRAGGDTLLVARSTEGDAGRWIIGVPAHPDPVLHEADSVDEVVSVVMDALEPPSTVTMRGANCEIPE